MTTRAGFFLLCVGLVGGSELPAARADDSSKGAKITELLQLTQARQFLQAVDGRFDQEDAVRTWGRYYSDNLTESDLDAILAYYRSPIGQKDISASRAALPQLQRYMLAKRTAVPAAAVAKGATTAAAVPATAADPVTTAVAVAPVAKPAGSRPWDSNPRAPDGRFVPSSSLPERCDVVPPTVPGAPAPPSGRSVVCVCTDEKGALTRDPVIAESSGDARVDSGAVKLARVGSGRYAPPILDGRPQSACFRFAIDFSRQQ
jgi:hypothetical protein